MLPLISVRREANRIDFYFNREVSRHYWIYTKKITIAIIPKFKWFELDVGNKVFIGTKLHSLQIGNLKILYVNWSRN
jgi:hypothetical protein